MLNSAGQSVVTPDVESYHLLYDNFVGMTYYEFKCFVFIISVCPGNKTSTSAVLYILFHSQHRL